MVSAPAVGWFLVGSITRGACTLLAIGTLGAAPRGGQPPAYPGTRP